MDNRKQPNPIFEIEESQKWTEAMEGLNTEELSDLKSMLGQVPSEQKNHMKSIIQAFAKLLDEIAMNI